MIQDMLGGGGKPWWQSRTILGGVVTGASILGGIGFGFSLDAETQKVVADQLAAFLTAGGALVGTALVIWGRFKASKTVTLTKGAAERINGRG